MRIHAMKYGIDIDNIYVFFGIYVVVLHQFCKIATHSARQIECCHKMGERCKIQPQYIEEYPVDGAIWPKKQGGNLLPTNLSPNPRFSR